ncbi:MAG: hypothetical protein ACRD3M_09605 [Thermoanaerobaculia bacterium]
MTSSSRVTPFAIVDASRPKYVAASRRTIFTPHRDKPSVQLKQTASFFREIPVRVLRDSLFPDELADDRGPFQKPEGW